MANLIGDSSFNQNNHGLACCFCFCEWFCFFFFFSLNKTKSTALKAFNLGFTVKICFGSLDIKNLIYISLKNIQFHFQEANLIIVFQHWDNTDIQTYTKTINPSKKKKKSHFCNPDSRLHCFCTEMVLSSTFFLFERKKKHDKWMMTWQTYLFSCEVLCSPVHALTL